jgi:hypothetical protein
MFPAAGWSWGFLETICAVTEYFGLLILIERPGQSALELNKM